ncbi:TPA: LOW QUALITY PROTEIN: hypothetical protein N0F65_008499 [Lagenidium giganteum]|uniref:Uncharacterized protein n=1 Tax=Lagenidium giganteum TaxID=4803 RepID=A0AAV2Z3J9_9STRA|nr:TPA: LOW QUALITY PROTEIN: hypothetical protein N0F65_008499 [Lagenidium giganteum]
MAKVAKALAQRISAYALSVKTVDAQVQAMVRTIRCPGGQWDIGVMLTTNDHIHKLNKGYRKKDKPTDILSFPFHKIRVPGRFPRVTSSDERYLGDIYISIPYVQSQCEVEDFTLEERMPVLLAHGICHLLGYDHERDEDFARMSKAEEYILDRYERLHDHGGEAHVRHASDEARCRKAGHLLDATALELIAERGQHRHLGACLGCLLNLSNHHINSVLSTPPSNDAVIFSPVVSLYSGLSRLYTTSSTPTEKKKRVDQSATRLSENTMDPFMSAITPSFWITRMPIFIDLTHVSFGVISCRNTGSVITRVLSSSVGLSAKPCTPPPTPPAITSAVPLLIEPRSTNGCSDCRVNAWPHANTEPLATPCTAPHGTKPSQMPTMPFLLTIWRVSAAYDSVGCVCFMILMNSR